VGGLVHPHEADAPRWWGRRRRRRLSQSSCSSSSNAIVFFPSWRYGVTNVFAEYQSGVSIASASAYARPASPICELPSIGSVTVRSAPWTSVIAFWGEPRPRRGYTCASRSARAAYAAAACPALPALFSAMSAAPCWRAAVIASDCPRSLNVPVGFAPSSFRRTRPTPIASASAGHSTSGVAPSPSDTAASGANGSSSPYRHIDSNGRSARSRVRGRRLDRGRTPGRGSRRSRDTDDASRSPDRTSRRSRHTRAL